MCNRCIYNIMFIFIKFINICFWLMKKIYYNIYDIIESSIYIYKGNEVFFYLFIYEYIFLLIFNNF